MDDRDPCLEIDGRDEMQSYEGLFREFESSENLD